MEEIDIIFNRIRMEGLIFLLVLVLIVGLIIFPITILIKIASVQSKVNETLSKLLFMEKRIMNIENYSKKSVSSESFQKEQEVQKELVDFKKSEQPFTNHIPQTEKVEVSKTVVSQVQPKLESQPEPIQAISSKKYSSVSQDTKKEVNSQKVLKPVNSSQSRITAPKKNPLPGFFNENLLTKIGIITLVLGIGFFVKYAIDQNWINEIGRVGIGILTGGLLIGIAHALRKKYSVFSAILVGGGVAVFYITITLAFREYQLFSQSVAFIILILITIFSVILSLLYDKKELAIFSLLGGFAAPFMISTGSGNYIVLFSYIFILNTGMLILSLKKEWRIIELLSFILTQFFWAGWIIAKFQSEILGAMFFSSLFFIQFYLLVLIRYFKGGKTLKPYHTILILANNLSILLTSLYVLEQTDLDLRGLAVIILAVINTFIMIGLYKRGKIDRSLIYTLIAVVMSLVSLAVPIQLNGYIITMFWAVEIAVLVWLWRQSKIVIFSYGFILLTILTIISYIIDVNVNYHYNSLAVLPLILNKMFITGVLIILVFAFVSFLFRKMDRAIQLNNLLTLNNARKVAEFLLLLFCFFVPFLELNYQLKYFEVGSRDSNFRISILVIYTLIYAASVTIAYRKKTKIQKSFFSILVIYLALFVTVYSISIINLRSAIYLYEFYEQSTIFAFHFLFWPFAIIIFAYLVKTIKQTLNGKWFSILSYVLTLLFIILISVEADNIMIMLFGNPNNYRPLLFDSHTFLYPIVWGIIALLFMIFGLSRKEVILRKISLSFFVVIILKFYIYDVWHMSQSGRIVSFVVLGIILLLVSFLQQKIKGLIKNTEEQDKQEINKL